jgi:filamentous hemagglutinin
MVIGRTLQAGGRTISKSTAEALNKATGSSLAPREWGRAVEALKAEHGLGPKFHGRITEYGHYLDDAGGVIDNIFNYL